MVQKTSIFILLLCFLTSFQSYGQVKGDTLFYKIKPEMIASARIEKGPLKEAEYYIFVHLKKNYHTKFATLTDSNIGNLLAVTYQGEVVSPTLPTIQAKLTQGYFSIGPFTKEKNAQNVLQKILNKRKE